MPASTSSRRRRTAREARAGVTSARTTAPAPGSRWRSTPTSRLSRRSARSSAGRRRAAHRSSPRSSSSTRASARASTPTRPATVRAYVPARDRASADRAVAEAAEALGHLQAFGLRPIGELRTRVVHESDWADAWKAYFPVMRVGRRIVIRPTWRRHRRRARTTSFSRSIPGWRSGPGSIRRRACASPRVEALADRRRPARRARARRRLRLGDPRDRRGQARARRRRSASTPTRSPSRRRPRTRAATGSPAGSRRAPGACRRASRRSTSCSRTSSPALLVPLRRRCCATSFGRAGRSSRPGSSSIARREVRDAFEAAGLDRHGRERPRATGSRSRPCVAPSCAAPRSVGAPARTIAPHAVVPSGPARRSHRSWP